MFKKKRFAVGAKVRIKNPGVNGVVTQANDYPTIWDEYWHKVRTEQGEFHEPGRGLQLSAIPTDLTGKASSQLAAEREHQDNQK